MIIGVDTHKRSHTFVTVDDNGKRLKVHTGATTTEANLTALQWAETQSDDRLWALEDNRSMSRRLERDLLLAGERVVRVPTKLMTGCRDSARTYGKSDPIDALAVARAALREPDLPAAVLDGPERDLRMLFDYRQTLVTQRTATVSRLRWDLHALDPSIDPKPRSLSRSAPLKALLPIIDRFDGVDARLAARRVATCIELTAEINDLEREITTRVQQIAPALMALVGFGALNAAKVVAHTAAATRFRSSAAFARYNGTAPLPVWSSNHQRHRLSRAGNRQLNSAIHIAAIVQIRLHPGARALYQRRISQGDGTMEALRIVKRRISDAVFQALTTPQTTSVRAAA